MAFVPCKSVHPFAVTASGRTVALLKAKTHGTSVWKFLHAFAIYTGFSMAFHRSTKGADTPHLLFCAYKIITEYAHTSVARTIQIIDYELQIKRYGVVAQYYVIMD